MSRWGLKYKGTEVLSPSEWNSVVDALEDLDKRIKCGISTFDGDGSTTEFKIEHGFTEAPTCVICGKGAPNLPDIDYWTADDTYITVVFKSAPPEGVGNIKIWFIVVLIT